MARNIISIRLDDEILEMADMIAENFSGNRSKALRIMLQNPDMDEISKYLTKKQIEKIGADQDPEYIGIAEPQNQDARKVYNTLKNNADLIKDPEKEEGEKFGVNQPSKYLEINKDRAENLAHMALNLPKKEIKPVDKTRKVNNSYIDKVLDYLRIHRWISSPLSNDSNYFRVFQWRKIPDKKSFNVFQDEHGTIETTYLNKNDFKKLYEEGFNAV